jgi:hypothetical protein
MKTFHPVRFFQAPLLYLLIFFIGCDSSDEPVVDPTGIDLETCYPSMTVGEQKQFVAVVNPVNASVRSYKWTSSDESVATITDAGQVTAIAAGTVSLTATTTVGLHTATCIVAVTEVPKKCFVTSYESVGTDSKKSVVTYKYDENNRVLEFEVTRDNSVSTTTFTYDGELVVSQITKSNAGQTILRDFEYDDKGRFIKDTYPQQNRLIYSYNENGMLSRVDAYFYNKTNAQYDKLYMVRKLTYSSPSSKNPQKIDEYDALGAWTITYEYEYDDKKNPIFELNVSIGTVPPNNIVKQTITQKDVTPSTSSYTNIYTYNGLGYPTTVQAGTTTRNYMYKCK